eukprot:CAMPEP_0115008186 /NCGR_PEP_ID=MMETSP0216-20121206/21733_1 /TAXON_ID=223996 /ORGANISM="Protocruzia adherens, Strain Boccale" /LENGTH=167 /DNA_ID=CAMNT_0002375487 /DNA_START=36 /DNA_END=539 /DNA_ORIENTATION=+
MAESGDDKITLVSKDGEKIAVEAKIKEMSGLVKNILEDQDPTEDINVESIDSATLKSVVSYCEHHNYTNPEPLRKPLPSNKLEDFLDAWDNEFVTGFDDDGLLNVVNAANFLDIKPLVDICLAKIACMFKGKSIEDLRKEYQIEQEFTPELEEEIKKEYPWAFEDDE